MKTKNYKILTIFLIVALLVVQIPITTFAAGVISSISLWTENYLQVPITGSNTYFCEATVYDDEGTIMNNEPVRFSVVEGNIEGVSINEDTGVITVESTAIIGTTFTIKATSVNNEEVSDIQTVTLIETPIPTTIEISGQENIEIPLQESIDVNYEVTIRDQNGNIMEGESAILFIEPEINGISINDRTVTIDSTVTASEFTLKAVSNTDSNVTSSKTIMLTKENQVVTTINLTGATEIEIPQGISPTSSKYTVTYLDQYGNEMYGENSTITIQEGEVEGVIFNNGTGYLIVDNSAQPGTITLVATSISNGNVQDTLEVNLIKKPTTLTKPTITQIIDLGNNTIGIEWSYPSEELENIIGYEIETRAVNSIDGKTYFGEKTDIVDKYATNTVLNILDIVKHFNTTFVSVDVFLNAYNHEIGESEVDTESVIVYPRTLTVSPSNFTIDIADPTINLTTLQDSNGNDLLNENSNLQISIDKVGEDKSLYVEVSSDFKSYRFKESENYEVGPSDTGNYVMTIVDIDSNEFIRIPITLEDNNQIIPSTYKVTFKVVDQNNQPLKDVIVDFNSTMKVTDDNGIVEFYNIYPGNDISYYISGENFSTISGTIDVNDSDVLEEIVVNTNEVNIEGEESIVSDIEIIGSNIINTNGTTSIVESYIINVLDENGQILPNETASMIMLEEIDEINVVKAENNKYMLEINNLSENKIVTLKAISDSNSNVTKTITVNIQINDSSENEVIEVESITIRGEYGRTYIDTYGGSLQLYADVFPENATNKTVKWQLVEGSYKATINQNGLLTARSGDSFYNGDVTVRAITTDGNYIYDEIVISISNQEDLEDEYENSNDNNTWDWDNDDTENDIVIQDKEEFEEREGAVNITEDVTIKEKDIENGHKVAEAKVKDYIIEKALKEKDNKEIVVEINNNTEEKVATISAAALDKMAEKRCNLVLKTRDIRLSIPSDIIDVEDIAQKLEEDINDIEVSIKVKNIPIEVQDDIIAETRKQDLTMQPITKILEFDLEVKGNNKTLKVKNFGNKFVKGEFPYSEFEIVNVFDLRKLNVYKYDEVKNRWLYRRSKVDEENKKVIFYTNSFSKYAIIEKDINFIDIYRHWAKDTVEIMAAKNIISGYGDNSFKPDKKITRAEFTAMLVRALGLSDFNDGDLNEIYFEDVNKKDWFAESVVIANTIGLFNNIERENEKIFNPDKPIPREEMTVMTMNAYNVLTGIYYKNNDTVNYRFRDHDKISDWAKEAVAMAKTLGIINGVEFNIFLPKFSSTRAEAAQILLNFLDKVNCLW